jgi:hypothetical protein
MRRSLFIATALAAFALSAPAAHALAPINIGSWPSAVGANSVTLRAEIDPGGLATTYLFEYTTDASFRTKGFIGATKVPQTGISIGTGSVQQRVGDLAPDTTYRFRVVSTNNQGITVGIGELQKERIFTTDELSPVFALPDGRGWEMVSPVEKNGGEIQGFGANHGGGVIQAAAQGGAITYTSASSFADPLGSPGPNQYVSTRGAAGGWTTGNVTLPMLSGSYPEAPTSGVPYQLFSSDLSGALVSNGRRCRTSAETQCPVANPPLPGSGAPAGYRNYYLRASADGSFRTMLSSAALSGHPFGPEDFEVAFVGATPDLAHVILSTCSALLPGNLEVPGIGGECDPTKQNLYKRSGSALTLINPAPGATLAAQSRAISNNGSRVYWSNGTNLYLYDAGVTKQVDAAQGGGGTFETASSDGSIAFFTKGGHLYRYAAATGAVTDIAPGGDVLGVVGASEDGTYLYYRTAAGLFLNRSNATLAVASQVDPASTPPGTSNARVSADGRRLLFVSTAELTPYDNRNVDNPAVLEPEVYLYVSPGTAGAGTVCASCNPSGERPLGPAGLPGASPNGSEPGSPHVYKPRVLSADSKHIFFDSLDALAVQDTNRDRDVYQWEASGVGSCVKPAGCVGLISSGRAEGGATFLDASADSSDAFFLTDGSLTPADNGGLDVYDARVGGGDPDSGLVIPCFGDACQPLPPEPENRTLGSLRSKASGNQDPVTFKPLRCKKNQVKKLGRCVKKKARHKKSPNKKKAKASK